MDEIELTRVVGEIMKLLQNLSEEEVEADGEEEIKERFEAIKRELGPWFVEGYPLFQAS
jgi:hypothetical protein